MNKLFCLTLCLIMLCVGTVYARAEEACVPYLEDVLGIPGTTPKDAAVLDVLGTSEATDISNQIYSNILLQDPDMFLLRDSGINKINPWEAMNNNELVWVKNKAAELLAECTDADEKIYTVAEYVALTVCYDYDYFTHNLKPYEALNHNAYDVLTNETAVCYGYSAAAAALLQSVGIPCILVHSPDHVWNMAYNGERWILFDTTWMSYNRYEYGVKDKKTYLDWAWYDYTIYDANSNYNHIITNADYAEYNNGIYSFPIYSKITSFEIPERITTIGDFAFNLCSDIELTYNGVFENVGKTAFQKCSLLQGVINISDIKSVGSYAFYGCTSITDVILGDGISEIPFAAFYGCSSLKGMVMPASITYIDEFAFQFCSSLSAIYYYGSSSDWNDIIISANNNGINRPAVYDYVPSIKITKQGSAIIKTSFIGIPFNEAVVLAEYKNGELANVICKSLEKTLSFDVSNNSEFKLFVFESLNTLCPLAKSTSTGTFEFNTESNGELSIENAEITEALDKNGYVDYDKVAFKAQINASDSVDDAVILLTADSGDGIAESIYFDVMAMPEDGIAEFTLEKAKIAAALGFEELADCSLCLKIGGTGIKKSVFKTIFYEEDLNEEEHGFRYNRLTRELDVITIGEMEDYASASAVPWHAHAADIISVNIGGGVTRIGNNAFADCTAIAKVKIPAGVQSIGANAFRGAEKLAEVKILSKDTVIEEGAFDGCSDALVLICIRNSKADEYAKAHGIDLSYISAGLSGDSNGDGEITIRDAALILQYIAGWNVYVDETIADANGDGDITIRDAALILQYIAGWDVTLG